MKTKEQILDQKLRWKEQGCGLTNSDIINIMQVYAKQEMIEFALWVQMGGIVWYTKGKWELPDEKVITDDELIDLYNSRIQNSGHEHKI